MEQKAEDKKLQDNAGGEVSAFDDAEMQEPETQKSPDLSAYRVERDFGTPENEEDRVIAPELLKRSRIQIAVTRLLFTIFVYDRY